MSDLRSAVCSADLRSAEQDKRMKAVKQGSIAQLTMLTAAVFVLAWQTAGAQSYTHGQNVSPA